MKVMPTGSQETLKPTKADAPIAERNHRRQAHFVLFACTKAVEGDIADALGGYDKKYDTSVTRVATQRELKKEVRANTADGVVIFARSSSEIPLRVMADSVQTMPIFVVHPTEEEIDITPLEEALADRWTPNKVMVFDEEALAGERDTFAVEALSAVADYRMWLPEDRLKS